MISIFSLSKAGTGIKPLALDRLPQINKSIKLVLQNEVVISLGLDGQG
jgi:hypothetical protein